jgi:hypothetical protein
MFALEGKHHRLTTL